MKMILKNELSSLSKILAGSLLMWGLLGATQLFAATLSVSPSTGVYTAGQTFSAAVRVNTAGKAINAAEGTVSFNTNELSVVGISKSSIFSLWTAEPSFSNSAGTITFSGGSPTGYSGGAGTILNITFRSKGSGNSKVLFSSGSVLAADGRGTNVLTSMNGGTYTIASAEVSPEPEVIEYIAPANTPSAPEITSTTHSDPDLWYVTRTAEVHWSLPSGITAVRTLLDGNSGSIPTRVYDDPISSITLDELEEGVQYFHLQFKNSDGWGRVAHYRLAVDSKKPNAFEIVLSDNADLSNPVQTLGLRASDTTSVVRRYLIQLDGGNPYEYIDDTGSSTVTLPALDPGHHTVIIEAFDEAGNSIISTLSFAILAFDKPQFTEYPSEISEQVIPVIKGITRAQSRISLTVREVGGKQVSATYDLTTDDNGVFTFIPEGRFTTGVYELSAVAVDQYGAQSEPSDSIRIAVQNPGYVAIGSLVVSFLSVIVPLVALILLMFLTVMFFFARIKKVRAVVTKETAEALVILDREFKTLRKTLVDNKSLLEKSRKTKKLTKAEAALIEQMNQALLDAKASIEKEIKDVDDIVE